LVIRRCRSCTCTCTRPAAAATTTTTSASAYIYVATSPLANLNQYLAATAIAIYNLDPTSAFHDLELQHFIISIFEQLKFQQLQHSNHF
jgi:predicted dithiol-disulfide oxidoreductase (DUF899 family)